MQKRRFMFRWAPVLVGLASALLVQPQAHSEIPFCVPHFSKYSSLNGLSGVEIPQRQAQLQQVPQGRVTFFPWKNPNTVGTVKALVLLVDFPDAPATRPNIQIRDAFFGTRADAPNGSVAQVYAENSYGKLKLEGIVLGNPRASELDHPDPRRQVKWIRLPQELSYYANNNFGGATTSWDRSVVGMTRDAIREVNSLYPSLNWAEFDGNGDNFIDLLYIVHAGEEGGSIAGANTIWPVTHPLLSDADTTLNDFGVVVSPTGPGGKPLKAQVFATGAETTGVGTFAHEIGHIFGLPDLYTNPQGLSVGIGNWSIMASGSRTPAFGPNEINSSLPTHFDPWSKAQLGWLTPRLVNRNDL
ncbi:MAG: M6 family metalloprotease domain-containing protein, partial [Armatimonadetes bacterium]|nr:M6 family metalloprotease domain-containing protein [Armatimonadota bacterium]